MSTVVITGANRGIGLELAKLYMNRGDTVIAGVRKPSPELQSMGIRVESDVDVADEASVRAFGAALRSTPVDLLINNAGVLSNETLSDLDETRIRSQFEVNALGPLRVTQALLGSLGKGAKVGIVTSRMGSVADNTSGGMYGYRMSKAAVNIAGVSLARDLEPKQIAVGLLHPGYVRTAMTGGRGHIDASEAARGIAARLDALDLATSGTFWHQNGEVLPW